MPPSHLLSTPRLTAIGRAGTSSFTRREIGKNIVGAVRVRERGN